MHRITNLRYLLADIPKKVGNATQGAKGPQTNMKPIKIDFPLPDKVKGIENRLNCKNAFEVPKELSVKNKPEFVIGKNVRLNYLMSHAEEYINKIVTVTGWAR